MAAERRVGRAAMLGSVPLDPVLQWREQLITDSDVWAQSYEGDVHDTLKLQSEIAGEIVEQFRIILNRQERAPLNNSMANNPDANGRGGGGSNKPVGHVGHAIAPEPDSANSYSGLAEAFASSGHR